MHGSPVVIRTFDLGADKNLRSAYRMAPNPALGLRAIRMSLAEPGMFLVQLRAILRASSLGHTQILIPMLSSSREVDQTLQMIEFAKQSLRDENKPFDEAIRIGCMVEIPATALSLELFMRKLDFYPSAPTILFSTLWRSIVLMKPSRICSIPYTRPSCGCYLNHPKRCQNRHTGLHLRGNGWRCKIYPPVTGHGIAAVFHVSDAAVDCQTGSAR